MLRAGQLLPPKGLLTLRFSTGRFPPALAACYRASWQLPGPDFHRLADTSLRVDHLNVTTSWSSLCTHAAGHTKLGLGDLVECWTLVGDERGLVAAKNSDTQLGFTLLLKFYGRFGRFPHGRSELHDDAVEFVARQLGVDAGSVGFYEWGCR